MVLSVNRIYDKSLDKYDVLDQSLIPSKDFIRNFGDVNDYVEAHIYTKDGRLLESEYNYKGFSIPDDSTSVDGGVTTTDSLSFDPASHVNNLGYKVGDFKVEYRVYRKKISDIAEKIFFISEISSDRKEIRISSNFISDSILESNTISFLYEIQTSPYFKDFLLNFGDNKVLNAVNIALDKSGIPYTLVIKLYNELPAEFDLKSSLWIVEELADPIQYEVQLALDSPSEVVEFLGPVNFNINTDSNNAISSDYQTINTIYSTDSLTSYQALVNKLKSNSVNINVDYSDLSNFIHFSSAVERLNNFVYKLQLIESYTANINVLKTVPNYTSSVVSQSVQTTQNSINSIIEKFDGYESYLYYTSGSNSWPKIGTYPSYSLAPTTSSVAMQWLGSYDESSVYYGGMLFTASVYDLSNQDNLVMSIPSYISEDADNEAYLLFVNMIGQHFDNIWVYIKAINDVHKADNSFKTGISKDMVYTALRSLGIKLYSNNSNENIFDYLIGNLSGSYNVTASATPVSGEDRTKEIFKRLYHNLPYLLKSKGSTRGIKALISTFGIPDTILSVNEFGGADKFSDTHEYTYDRFSYGLRVSGSSNLDLKWAPLTQNQIKYTYFAFVPDSIELRFKPDASKISDTATLLQQFSDGVLAANFGVNMYYTSSNGVPSANIQFLISDGTEYVSSSLTLPVYATGSDGDTSWWNLLLRRNYKYTDYYPSGGTVYNTSSLQQYDLIIKNEISGRIGHQASASLYVTGSNSGSINHSWSSYGDITNHLYLTVGSPSIANATFPSGSNFNGWIQEVRYWSEPLSVNAFDNHVLNPESYEGNYSGSAYNDLAARFPLGNNLVRCDHSVTSSIESVHPNYRLHYSSGSIGNLDSISLYGSAIYGVNLYGATGSLPYVLDENKAYFFRFPAGINKNYYPFYDIVYANSINSGYYTPVNEKIRVVDNSVQSDVLSPYVRLEKLDVYRTKDTKFTDVSLSPQNEVDKDIIAEYGSTINLDNILGDPSKQYEQTYSDLDKLKEDYYKKFASSFNYTDYILAVKSIDNTLFKMIEDYVPGRTSLSTGITIKSPILERNRIQRHRPGIVVEDIEESLIDITDVFADTPHTDTNGSSEPFISGELNGSTLDVDRYVKEGNFNPYLFTTGSINQQIFNLTDFNVEENVVIRNITSSVFKTVDKFNDEVLYPAEIQDGYYSYRRNSLPRYEGCKTTSKYYNVYTPGDSSKGKTAAIDYNVGKFAWVNSVYPKNLNFYNKTTVNIKYLIDASGSVTELNTANKNLFEVQNTFKSGDQVTVSLFDKVRPTNQANLNGLKEIFLGGFSYTPILFRDLDETLYFQYLNPNKTESLNLGVKAYSTSSYKYTVYDGSSVRYPFQSPNNAGSGYYFNQDGIPVNIPMVTKYYLGTNYRYAASAIAGVNTGSVGSFTLDPGRPQGYMYEFDLLKYMDTGSGYNTEPNPSTYQYVNGSYCYLVPRSGTYTISGSVLYTFTGADTNSGWSVHKMVAIVEKTTTPFIDDSWIVVANTKLSSPDTTISSGYDSNSNAIFWDGQLYKDWVFNLNIPSNTTASLTAGEYVRMRLFLLDLGGGFNGGNWQTFIFNIGNNSFFEIYDSGTKISNLITTGSIGQIPDLFTYDSGSGTGVIFNDSASLEFYTQSVFIPNNPYAGYYTPVYEPFEIYPGDLFRFGQFKSPSSKYYEVDSVDKTGGSVKVHFSGDVNYLSGSVNQSAFAILRKIPDETSVILNFNKIDGEASKALLIPNNLEKPVLDNVANIVEPLKISLNSV